MLEKFYIDKLYPFQDEILLLIQDADLDFYLTGGTVLSRHYLRHRYSDDLDFFVNASKDFKAQADKIVAALRKAACQMRIGLATEAYVRLLLERDGLLLKVDLINDVPFHFGELHQTPLFYRTDNWRNILSNKLCAMGRAESKDLADILFIAKAFNFEWKDIFREAREKDIWVDPIEICRLIKTFPVSLFDSLKWISRPDPDWLKEALLVLHDDIFWGNANSVNSQTGDISYNE